MEDGYQTWNGRRGCSRCRFRRRARRATAARAICMKMANGPISSHSPSSESSSLGRNILRYEGRRLESLIDNRGGLFVPGPKMTASPRLSRCRVC
jgi:hypothetical protein